MTKTDRILTGDEKDLVSVELSLDQLVKDGDAKVVRTIKGVKHYRLTKKGEKHAIEIIKNLTEKEKK